MSDGDKLGEHSQVLMNRAMSPVINYPLGGYTAVQRVIFFTPSDIFGQVCIPALNGLWDVCLTLGNLSVCL